MLTRTWIRTAACVVFASMFPIEAGLAFAQPGEPHPPHHQILESTRLGVELLVKEGEAAMVPSVRAYELPGASSVTPAPLPSYGRLDSPIWTQPQMSLPPVSLTPLAPLPTYQLPSGSRLTPLQPMPSYQLPSLPRLTPLTPTPRYQLPSTFRR